MPKVIAQVSPTRYILSGRLFPGGKHTNPRMVKRNQEKFVFKRSSVGKGLNNEQAATMTAALKEYWKLLQKTGANVSRIELAAPVRDYSIQGKSYFVGSLEEYKGRRNLAELFSTASQEKVKHLFSEMLHQAYLVMGTDAPNRVKSKILIDAKPENYVLSKDGKVYFIDFYTPKLMDSAGVMYPFYPNLHGQASYQYLKMRFGDKRALFHVLLANSIAARPALRRVFEDVAQAFLESKGETRVLSYIKTVQKRDYRPTKLIRPELIKKIQGN